MVAPPDSEPPESEPAEPAELASTESAELESAEPEETEPNEPGETEPTEPEETEPTEPAELKPAKPEESEPTEPAELEPEPVLVPLTGAAPAESAAGEWFVHECGRWVVGDPGRQLEVAWRPSESWQSRPDVVLDWAACGDVEYRAASVRGLGHFQEARPRQDGYAVAFTPDRRWLVGCVADGVSSGSRSHLAADIACQEFTRRLAAELAQLAGIPPADQWPEAAAGLRWQQATDAVTEQISLRATEFFREGYQRQGDEESLRRLAADGLPHQAAAQVMATTAVAFVVASQADVDGLVPFALVVAAGDSSALLLSEGCWHPMTAVKNAGAELASSAVRPLPRQVTVTPVTGFLQQGQALAVITDGLGDPLGSGQGVVGRFLASRWTSAPDPLAFVNEVAFYRKTFVDDRTAVLVWAGQGR